MTRWLSAALVLVVATSAFAKPPSWDKQIDGPGRFKVLAAFDGAAVLDKETGLVWERAPIDAIADWANAVLDCTLTEIGGRMGWRLPRIEELLSVLDPLATPPAGQVPPPRHAASSAQVRPGSVPPTHARGPAPVPQVRSRVPVMSMRTDTKSLVVPRTPP